MNSLKWNNDTDFKLGDYTLSMNYVHGGTQLKSSDEKFILVKAKGFLQHYTSLVPAESRKILELGVFQGGSFVFLDQLLHPEKIAAIELSTTPIPALDRYVEQNSDRAKLYYGTSQDDAEKLRQIVHDDFGGELDLVVDDASHFYEQTKASFKTLFPLVRPGGMYIIEDWSWSFQDEFQAPDNAWYPVPSPANLMTELLEEMIRNNLIADIEVHRELWKIRRTNVKAGDVFASHGRRGRQIGLL